GLSGHIVGTVHHGECYTFNGGILTKDGYTWYQLQHVHGGLAWVAGNFLHTQSHSHCTGGGSSSSGSHTFTSGVVSQHCMQCICNLESGCRPLACKWDVNSNSCGYFQIKEVWKHALRFGVCIKMCTTLYVKVHRLLQVVPTTVRATPEYTTVDRPVADISSTLGYWDHIQAQGCHASS
ncbi:hypothetical protein KUTeg_023022, partial [Tegillarca granosa]